MLLVSGLAAVGPCSEDTGASSFAKASQDCCMLMIISWEWARPMVGVFG